MSRRPKSQPSRRPGGEPAPGGPSGRKRFALDLIVCAGLISATLAVYLQVAHDSFIGFDDGPYVFQNPIVMGGLTARGLAWAFGSIHSANWHPLTWLSLMLDCEISRADPGFHHLVNVVLHLCNTLLLYFLLRRLTGFVWRSALVAALFALHPLHVESVAWISERKDVLSALLCLLALWAYVRYAEAGSRGRYWTVMIVFAAGLMAKPMLVTVPFLLLVLDYWPLGRLRLGSPAAFREFRTALSPLVREKLPLFALAAASSTVTVIAQGEAVSSFERLPFATRVGNSIISYTTYLWMTIWPARLGLLYPYPRGSVEAWKTLGSLLLIGGITILAVRQARKRPYLVAGWCWYLGMLVPAIGLVQVGAQARADRYTYLPLIGLFLIVAWGLGEAAARRRALRTAVTVLATAAVAALALRAHTQAGYWRNSITLYERTLEVAPDNPIMLLNLGIEYMDRGRLDEAMACYRKALPLEPGSGRLHAALGTTLARKGRHEEAMEHLKEALRLNPGLSFANHSMGVLLLSQKKLEEALPFLRDSVRNDPENADAHNTLGAALLLQGKAPEAIEQFNAALRIRPDFPDARNNLRTAMQSAGKE